MPLLRGRHHLFKLSPETWIRAKECFEHAIALDPEYADAHAYLGLGYFFMGMNGILPLREVAHLDPRRRRRRRSISSRQRLGRASFWAGSPLPMTMTGRRPPSTSMPRWPPTPVVPNARWAYASFCSNPFGRFQDSVANMQLEVEQDPLNVLWRTILANHLHHAGMHDQAIVEAQKALDSG